MKLVLTKDILDRLIERTDKYVAFLRFWLSMVDTKAEVTLSAWKSFQKHWESELKELPETRDSFFANIRGLSLHTG